MLLNLCYLNLAYNIQNILNTNKHLIKTIFNVDANIICCPPYSKLLQNSILSFSQCYFFQNSSAFCYPQGHVYVLYIHITILAKKKKTKSCRPC